MEAIVGVFTDETKLPAEVHAYKITNALSVVSGQLCPADWPWLGVA